MNMPFVAPQMGSGHDTMKACIDTPGIGRKANVLSVHRATAASDQAVRKPFKK